MEVIYGSLNLSYLPASSSHRSNETLYCSHVTHDVGSQRTVQSQRSLFSGGTLQHRGWLLLTVGELCGSAASTAVRYLLSTPLLGLFSEKLLRSESFHTLLSLQWFYAASRDVNVPCDQMSHRCTSSYLHFLSAATYMCTGSFTRFSSGPC